MIGEQNKFPNNYMETWIYLQPNDELEMRGILLHKASGLGWRFRGTVELMKYYEKLFNTANYPQPTHQLREIKPLENTTEKRLSSLQDMAIDKKEIPTEETKPTFVIKVQYRQNASWQGTIKWLEGNVEKQFRSALELIKLMDSVIERNDTTGWE